MERFQLQLTKEGMGPKSVVAEKKKSYAYRLGHEVARMDKCIAWDL